MPFPDLQDFLEETFSALSVPWGLPVRPGVLGGRPPREDAQERHREAKRRYDARRRAKGPRKDGRPVEVRRAQGRERQRRYRERKSLLS